MNQNQFDALVSFCYNTGGGDDGISASPLVKFLQGKLSESEARRQYSQYWIYAGGKVNQGLINRRNRESDLFFKAVNENSKSNKEYDFLIIDARWTSEKVSSERIQRVVNILINKYEARYGKQEGMSYKILKQLAYLYVDETLKLGIDVGVAWSQAIMETDAFTFSNPKGPSDNTRNFGALTDSNGQFFSYKNNRDAVKAHVQALYVFALRNGLYDATVSMMTNKWNRIENYGEKLNKFITEIFHP